MADSDLILDLVLDLDRTGLFVTVPVDWEAGPYLVTGTKDLIWIPEAKDGVIRSGVRPGSPDNDLFLSAVREIGRFGDTHDWGNHVLYSSVGLLDAEDYLFSYGILEFDLLCHDGDPILNFPHSEATRMIPAPWVPQNCSVLVPRFREYLGFVGLLKNSHTAVFHNPSRGMVVLGSW